MIQDQYKLLLVNLETGAQTDFAERLDSQAMQQPMPPTRAVYFAGWSPDMREAEVAFDGRCPHHQPGVNLVTDMYINAQTPYRCSVGPYQYTEVDYGWQRRGDAYKFELLLKNRHIRIYDKNTNRACS